MRGKLALGILGAACGACLLDRLGRRWGATDAEVRDSLPGDELVERPIVQTTHAVTIHAPAAVVWPWLVQMGYGRAGWYTNRWWYRLIDEYVWHSDMPRVERIIPELQHLAKGDTIPDGPPGAAYFTVAKLEPERALVLYSITHGTIWLPRALRDNPQLGIHGELDWSFTLREPASGTTRLILRSRGGGGPAVYRALMRAFFPPADFFVARLMLLTIKQNVERTARRARRADSGIAASAGARSERASIPTAI